MHSHDEKPPYIPEPGKKYETDEVTYPAIGKAGVALIVFFLMNLVLASGAYYVFVVRETVQPKHIFDATPKAQDANVPVLQKDPIADIHRFRADEYRVEHAYEHWTDGDGKKSLRIPVERALEIVKEKGLPAPKPAVVPAAASTVRSGAVVPPPSSTLGPAGSQQGMTDSGAAGGTTPAGR